MALLLYDDYDEDDDDDDDDQDDNDDPDENDNSVNKKDDNKNDVITFSSFLNSDYFTFSLITFHWLEIESWGMSHLKANFKSFPNRPYFLRIE